MGLKTVYLTAAAKIHRRRFEDVSWLGVTGSTGKTTVSVLLTAVLKTKGPVRDGSVVRDGNTIKRLAATILGVRPDHRFCVAEISGWKPGFVRRKASLLRPAIGIVTGIGHDHRSNFKSLDRTALEKSELVKALPENGFAVLNADDPRVWDMRHLTAAEVIGFGKSPDAQFRLLEATSSWPDRLALRIRHGGQERTIQSRFVGPYAAGAISAALAGGFAAGVPLDDAVDAIEAVEPLEGRMRPYVLDRGATYIDDGWKCPFDSVAAALTFLKEAEAKRKIIVFGEISDSPGAKGARYRQIARSALQCADVAVYVGQWAGSVRKLREFVDAGQLYSFERIGDAAGFLDEFVVAGDLVLIKGSQRADHLERLILREIRAVGCARDRCRRFIRCTDCELIDVPEEGKAALAAAAE